MTEREQPKGRLPSYSTIRRVLLHLDYEQYSASLARFFGVQPLAGETLALDGKVLKSSYQLEDDNPNSPPHPAIMLVSAYIVERGLILEPYEVSRKTNEIKAIPELLFETGSQRGSFRATIPSIPKKNL